MRDLVTHAEDNVSPGYVPHSSTHDAAATLPDGPRRGLCHRPLTSSLHAGRRPLRPHPLCVGRAHDGALRTLKNRTGIGRELPRGCLAQAPREEVHREPPTHLPHQHHEGTTLPLRQHRRHRMPPHTEKHPPRPHQRRPERGRCVFHEINDGVHESPAQNVSPPFFLFITLPPKCTPHSPLRAPRPRCGCSKRERENQELTIGKERKKTKVINYIKTKRL